MKCLTLHRFNASGAQLCSCPISSSKNPEEGVKLRTQEKGRTTDRTMVLRQVTVGGMVVTKQSFSQHLIDKLLIDNNCAIACMQWWASIHLNVTERYFHRSRI
jgi:hypothetical protein